MGGEGQRKNRQKQERERENINKKNRNEEEINNTNPFQNVFQCPCFSGILTLNSKHNLKLFVSSAQQFIPKLTTRSDCHFNMYSQVTAD